MGERTINPIQNIHTSKKYKEVIFINPYSFAGSSPIFNESLVQYYDVTDASSLTIDTTSGTNTIAELRDKSGYGNHLGQTDKTKQPLYFSSGGRSDRAYLQFDGSNDFLFKDNITLYSQFTIIGILQNNNNSGTRVLFNIDGGTNVTYRIFLMRVVDGKLNSWAFNYSGSAYTSAIADDTINLSTTTFQTLEYVRPETGLSVFRDQIAAGSVAIADDTASPDVGGNTPNFYMGMYGDGSSFVWFGSYKFEKLMIYNKALNDTDRAAAREYLLNN